MEVPPPSSLSAQTFRSVLGGRKDIIWITITVRRYRSRSTVRSATTRRWRLVTVDYSSFYKDPGGIFGEVNLLGSDCVFDL